MSQANVELAVQVMDALGRRDISRVIALTDPEVEWHSFFAELGDKGVYLGHEVTRQYMRDLNDAWEIVRADVDNGLGVGDIALLVGRIHYRGKASGVEIEQPMGWLCTLQDGKLAGMLFYSSHAEALEAVGLSEQDAHPDS